MSLSDLEVFIGKNKHLPGIDSASDLEAYGMSVSSMQRLHMQKIEELTLYILELQAQVKELQQEIKRK